MKIPEYHSIKSIKKQYNTGEEPVLVKCSDLNEYICKYMRSSATPYKLVCEIIGAVLASEWELRIPKFALIQILPEHWTPFRTINLSAPAFGSQVQKSVIDVTSSWNDSILISTSLQQQILKISLFDIWVANEDRNWNNANLMYDTKSNALIVIDHGCILNTATFDYKLSLLTENESILYSELAHAILKELSTEISTRLLSELEDNFKSIRYRKDEIIEKILEFIPANWNVSIDMVYSKMNQLFDQKWMDDCWKTFIEYFNQAAK